MTPSVQVADRRTRFIQESWSARTFRVNREVFRSEEVLERERRQIWDRKWLYLGHESEVPKRGDFKQRTLAGRPLIFARDSNGRVRAYLNSCPHRGTVLCRETEGNSKTFQCFYHAWTFANTGELVGIPDVAAYPPERGFAAEMGLRELPRFENYRGFVFVSFAADGESLSAHLGNARDYLDLMVEHSPSGLEVLPGTHLYSIRGNWKLAVENAMDGYHFSPTHVTFVEYLKNTGYVTSDEGGRAVTLDNGHCVLVFSGHGGRVGMQWEPRFGEAERLRVEDNVRQLKERLGEDRGARVANTSRILYLFPNLLLFDIEGLAARQLEPVRPDFTDVRAWELAPAGESNEARELRIRILGSFIGPGGLATPDDVEAYECVQRGVVATAGDARPNVDWSDISRGMEREARGEPARNVDEAGIRGFWRYWDDMVERDGSGANGDGRLRR
ncbi:MAG TPA: aromatic ring-hydroxylating dioxygenase subunit alpha [Candidatus Limnocylindria bacterium]|jgi:phenylpropionate dioxygenase-like ring-hydroxylating dioxygenase large terminal subunit